MQLEPAITPNPKLSYRARIIQNVRRIYPLRSFRNVCRKRTLKNSPYGDRLGLTSIDLTSGSISQHNPSQSSLSAEGYPTTPVSPITETEDQSTLSKNCTTIYTDDATNLVSIEESSLSRTLILGEKCLPQETIKPFQTHFSTQETTEDIYPSSHMPNPMTFPSSDRRMSFDFWGEMPHEIALQILANLTPKELVRASAVSKRFSNLCYDGQLWTSFDASKFYKEISAESLAKILVAAGPFVKDLNLRGCIQVEHYKRAEVVVKACNNLINATLEGCRNFQRSTLHGLLRGNDKLVNLNLTGLSAVTNGTCKIIAQTCPCLETFDISWCTRMDARGIRMVVRECTKLKDLRAGEIKGTSCLEFAQEIFETNKLERLILSGCTDFTDQALQIMMHGKDPEIDILTNTPLVPVRRLRDLDISRCHRITDSGIKALSHLTYNLQGLHLSGCSRITDDGLASVVVATPCLTHLDLEQVFPLTNDFFIEKLAKAPCASLLKHLCISHCDQINDTGMLPIFQTCTNLQSVDMDGTNISDLVLTEAASMLRSRCEFTKPIHTRPEIGLRLVVYDCHNVSWAGVREVMSRNSEFRKPTDDQTDIYMTELIALKCYYCWQMTVDEHTKRLLRGDIPAACRLEKLWGDWMMANEEIGTDSPGMRRRRRRARDAQVLHANEEEGRTHESRRRNRAWNNSCMIM